MITYNDRRFMKQSKKLIGRFLFNHYNKLMVTISRAAVFITKKQVNIWNSTIEYKNIMEDNYKLSLFKNENI